MRSEENDNTIVSIDNNNLDTQIIQSENNVNWVSRLLNFLTTNQKYISKGFGVFGVICLSSATTLAPFVPTELTAGIVGISIVSCISYYLSKNKNSSSVELVVSHPTVLLTIQNNENVQEETPPPSYEQAITQKSNENANLPFDFQNKNLSMNN